MLLNKCRAMESTFMEERRLLTVKKEKKRGEQGSRERGREGRKVLIA